MHRCRTKRIDKEVGKHTLKCDGAEIERKKEFKYLGIWIDEKLNWNRHLMEAKKKGMKTLIATSKMVGKTYGLSPYLTNWVYESICLPRMLYACFAWWKRDDDKLSNKLETVRSLAMRITTGAMKTTPIAVMEALLRTAKIHDKAGQIATNTVARLALQGRTKQLSNPQANYFNTLEQARIFQLPESVEHLSDSNPFIINEQCWKLNSAEGKKRFTYVMKDMNVKRKNIRWLISVNNGVTEAKAVKSERTGAKSSHGLIALRELLSQQTTKLIATDDAILINKLKQKAPNLIKTQCLNEAHRRGVEAIQVTRCNPLHDKDMGWLREACSDIINQGAASTPVSTAPRCLDDFKKDTKTHLEDKISKYWWSSLNGERRSRNPGYLRFPEKLFHQPDVQTAKDLLKWDRKDLRLLTCIMSGKALDRMTITHYQQGYDPCSYCNEPMGNNMEHWLGECICFDTRRLELTQQGTRGIESIKPLDWINFAKVCGFSKFAFNSE
jgi:hypothetical protein